MMMASLIKENYIEVKKKIVVGAQYEFFLEDNNVPVTTPVVLAQINNHISTRAIALFLSKNVANYRMRQSYKNMPSVEECLQRQANIRVMKELGKVQHSQAMSLSMATVFIYDFFLVSTRRNSNFWNSKKTR